MGPVRIINSLFHKPTGPVVRPSMPSPCPFPPHYIWPTRIPAVPRPGSALAGHKQKRRIANRSMPSAPIPGRVARTT